jgi:hypothetical protein
MNIPFIQKPSYVSNNVHIGNSGAGYNINKPTIPKIDFNPPTDFIIGRYNNNIQPTELSTLYCNSDKLYYHSNNPINGNNWINNRGLNGNGGNRGSFYKPNNWSPYDLNDSKIPSTYPNSQTFAYNNNSEFIDGSVTRSWPSYKFDNANSSTGGLEQIPPRNEIELQQKMTDEEYYAELGKLKDEMD